MNGYNWPMSMPYDTINVHDQTYYKDTAENIDVITIPSDPIAFIPFVSPKGFGEDNELVYLDATSIKKYGNPDYYKYGLSLYLANQFIDGGGSVLGMRLKAKNATHSHIGIVNDIQIVNEVVLNTVVGENNELTYYPYFKRSGENNTELPTYFDGITYTYAYTDAEGVEHPEAVTIDPEAKTGKKITDPETHLERDELVTDIYKINEDNNICSAADNTLLYELLRKDVVNSNLKTVSFDTADKAGDKEKLENAFAGYVSDGAKSIPENLGELVSKVISEGQTETKLVELEKNVTYSIPLFMLYAIPSGPNSYSISLSYDNTMETYAYNNKHPERFYKISTYDGNNEIENRLSFTFSEYVYSNQSMNVEDVILDNCKNIGYVPGRMDLMYKVLDLYVTNTNLYTADGNDHNAIDILFGNPRQNEYNNYRVNGFDEASMFLRFEHGSLGDFASPDDDVRNTAINDAFAAAYGGQITDLIYDEIRFPFLWLLQPCEDVTVADKMFSLADVRESTEVMMYIPETKTYSEARSIKANSYSTYDTSKVFFHTESAIIRDPYTHKRIRMPAVYFDAKAIPRTLTTYGYGTPFAGSKFYWDGFVTNTMLPRTTNNAEYIDNHNSTINTMIEDGNGYAYAVEQITSQLLISQLSEINNAITLRRMCNIALKVAHNKRWTDLSDPEELNSYRESLRNEIDHELSNAYKTLEITVQPESTNGAGNRRLHCVITVSFDSLLKGVSYDIYII